MAAFCSASLALYSPAGVNNFLDLRNSSRRSSNFLASTHAGSCRVRYLEYLFLNSSMIEALNGMRLSDGVHVSYSTSLREVSPSSSVNLSTLFSSGQGMRMFSPEMYLVCRGVLVFERLRKGPPPWTCLATTSYWWPLSSRVQTRRTSSMGIGTGLTMTSPVFSSFAYPGTR
jgi:hypothetical protein